MKSTAFLAAAFLISSLAVAGDARALCGPMGSDRDDMLYGTEFQSRGDYDTGVMDSDESAVTETDEFDAAVPSGAPFDQGETLDEESNSDIKLIDEEIVIDVPDVDVPDVDVPDVDVPDFDAPDLDEPDLDVGRDIDLI